MKKFSFNIRHQKIFADHHQRFATRQYWNEAWYKEYVLLNFGVNSPLTKDI